MCTISVAMTTYNGEKYILDQLISLRDQTQKADEVVIVDDASLDKTAALIADFIKKNELSNWKLVINKTNKGWVQNFYYAISLTIGVSFLLEDKNDSIVKFVICILLAATFHYISLLYLSLLLVRGEKTTKFRRQIITGMFIISLLASFIIRLNVNWVVGIGMFLFSARSTKSLYYVQGNVRFGFLIYLFNQVLYLFAIYYSEKDLLYSSYFNEPKKIEAALGRNLFWINLIVTIFFPLCMINVEFSRIFRNITQLNYCGLALTLNRNGKQTSYRFISILLFLFAMFMNFYLNMANTSDTPARVFFSLFGSRWK